MNSQLKKIMDNAENIVFFGGAGVSTESNIPDFRGSEGLYQKQTYPYPAEVMLSSDFFYDHIRTRCPMRPIGRWQPWNGRGS